MYKAHLVFFMIGLTLLSPGAAVLTVPASLILVGLVRTHARSERSERELNLQLEADRERIKLLRSIRPF